MDRDALLACVESLTMAPAADGGRHPHKPLLLLWLLARHQRGERGPVAYTDVQEPVDRLLAEFGTPAKRSKDRAAMPFFHLEADLWDRWSETGDELDNSGGRLRRAQAKGRLQPEVEELLVHDPGLVSDVATLLFDRHFTDTHVDLICDELALELDGRRTQRPSERRRRDPRFRQEVLTAYGNVCAMCGWDGRLRTQPVGVAAAHIRWHGHDGPDTVDNGLALCELHHKLLDLGVIGITPDRHIQLSTDFVASSEVGHRLGHDLDGRPIARTQPRYAPPAEEFLRWHASEVFRGAA